MVDNETILKRTRYGAFMKDLELFDNAHFSVSPSEAAAMDPQQRMMLESSYEALHASSISRASCSAR